MLTLSRRRSRSTQAPRSRRSTDGSTIDLRNVRQTKRTPTTRDLTPKRRSMAPRRQRRSLEEFSLGALTHTIRGSLAGLPKLYWNLLSLVLGLSVIGLVMVLSASYVLALNSKAYGFNGRYFFEHQFVFFGIGVVLMVTLSFIDLQRIRRLVPAALAVTIGLLIVVLVVSSKANVAKLSSRWIDVGFMTIQPAELAKLVAILFTASVLTKLRNLDDWRSWVYWIGGGIGAMLILIKLQPDHGTVLLIAAVVAAILCVAGVRLQWAVLSILLACPVVLWLLTQGYHASRWISLDPRNGSDASTYQARAALTGIRLGGLWGAGLGESKMKWGRLPEAHTDEIFAVICEELGMIRAAAIVLLLAFLVGSCFEVARRSRDRFARLTVLGIGTWLGLQAVINIGVAVALVPNKGFTLPFISYGGSALLVMMTAMGLVLSAARSSAT